MVRSLITTTAVAALLVAGSANAAEPFVKKEVADVVTQFQDSRLADKMFQAIESIIASASEKLEKEGHRALAGEIVGEWMKVASLQAGQFGALDLGDHEPMSQWLARTYDRIESKLGKRICRWSRFDDLKVFNFAIPVVFRPRGTASDSWDKVEYGKHFVPFSGAVTYWTVNSVCGALTSGWVGYACGTISEAPRFAMEKWIAPHLSNRVYHLANGDSCDHHELSESMDLDALITLAEGQVEGASVRD